MREKEATQEEKEEKARNTSLKTKTPHRDVRKKTHSDELCDDVKKKATRRIMLQRYNDKITQK